MGILPLVSTDLGSYPTNKDEQSFIVLVDEKVI